MLKPKLCAILMIVALSQIAYAHENSLAKLTQNLAAPQTASSPKHDHNAWLEIDTAAFEHNIATVNELLGGKQGGAEITQSEIEDINGALLADLYTVWGNSNPRVKK